MENELFKKFYEGDSDFVQPNEIEKTILFRSRQFENVVMSTKKIKHLSNSFIEMLCKKYRRGFLKGYQIKRSSYTLSIVTKDMREMYENEDVHRTIYSIKIDTEKNTLKKYLNYDIDLPGDYCIEICVCLQTETYEYFEDFSLRDDIPYIEAFKVELCCVCYENKPNILYPDCLHLAICIDCQEKGDFKQCQLCRKEITYKIKI